MANLMPQNLYHKASDITETLTRKYRYSKHMDRLIQSTHKVDSDTPQMYR